MTDTDNVPRRTTLHLRSDKLAPPTKPAPSEPSPEAVKAVEALQVVLDEAKDTAKTHDAPTKTG